MKKCVLLALVLALLATIPALAGAAEETLPAPDELLEPTAAAPADSDMPEIEATEAPAPEATEASAPQIDDTAAPEPGEITPAGEGEAAPEEDETVPSVVLQLEAQKKPLTGVKIGIDPGHQAHGNSEREAVAPGSSEKKAKVTTGTSGTATGIPEYVTNLEISLKLRDALISKGAEVYMTRDTHDVDISNQERAKMMNDYGVDLMLRIHCDGAEKRSKHGISLYCSRSNAIAEESHRAAETILPAVCEATGAKDNGIISNDNYTGQNWAEVPCLMVECGFLSNPDEDKLLNDEDYQWKLAAGLTGGIIDYIRLRDGEQAYE